MPIRALLVVLTLVSTLRFCSDDEPAVAPTPPSRTPITPGAPSGDPELPPPPIPAIAIPATAGTLCEQAYDGLQHQIDSLRNHVAGPAMMPHIPEPPPRDRFLEGCELLPEEMQECMHPDYTLAHNAECQRRRDRVDVDVLRRAMAIVAP